MKNIFSIIGVSLIGILCTNAATISIEKKDAQQIQDQKELIKNIKLNLDIQNVSQNENNL